jgi:hypothetical protein
MILLDAGYLIALAKPRDALHTRALAWAACVEEPVILTEFTLCEVVDALSRPADRPKAHALISDLRPDPACKIVPASSHLVQAGLRLHASRLDKEWSLTDCMSFVVMREEGIRRALAFDQHFEQAGFEALLRRDPP